MLAAATEDLLQGFRSSCREVALGAEGTGLDPSSERYYNGERL